MPHRPYDTDPWEDEDDEIEIQEYDDEGNLIPAIKEH